MLHIGFKECAKIILPNGARTGGYDENLFIATSIRSFTKRTSAVPIVGGRAVFNQVLDWPLVIARKRRCGVLRVCVFGLLSVGSVVRACVRVRSGQAPQSLCASAAILRRSPSRFF